MKNLIFCLAFVVCLFAACTQDDDPTPGGAGGNLGDTNWRVSYYWDKDKDETDDFNGYTFEFRADGVLVAQLPDGSQRNGLWALQDSNTELRLIVVGTEALDDFSDDDWNILERTDTSIKLRDDSGSGGTEELHLQRL